MAENMIRSQEFKKYFKTRRGTLQAVDDVSFQLKKENPRYRWRVRLREVNHRKGDSAAY